MFSICSIGRSFWAGRTSPCVWHTEQFVGVGWSLSLKTSVERWRKLRSLLSLMWSLASNVTTIQHALWDVLLYTCDLKFFMVKAWSHGILHITTCSMGDYACAYLVVFSLSASTLSCSPLCAGSISGAGCSFIIASQQPWSVTWHHVSASSHHSNTDTHKNTLK